ncbi:MAG: HD domain-containing phosphohydrolase [Pseudomonadota bacterium]
MVERKGNVTPEDPKDPGSVLKNVFDTERERDPEVVRQALGRELVNRLFMLYRTARLHALDNEAVTATIEAFRKVLEELQKVSETPRLTAMEDSFYLDGARLKADFTSFENFRFLSQLFAKLKIGSLQFAELPEPTELREFVGIMLKSEEGTLEWIGNQMFPSFRVMPPGDMMETSESVAQTESLSDPLYLLKLYAKARFFMTDFLGHLKKGDFLSMSRLQRIVHEFIDAMGEDVDTLLILAGIRGTANSLVDRAVHVMILSLLLGREIGMNKRQLSDLGPAALLHDIGKADLPPDLLDKTEALTEEDWKKIREAPMNSLLQLIRLKGFNESTLKRMLVAYEHAEGAREGLGKFSLLARIVTVAHCYVAMTSPQTYRDALFPHEALTLMRKEAGRKFDPLLLELLVHLVTPHPPGTVLLLDTGEVAIVASRAPMLKILYDAAQQRVDRPSKSWDRIHPRVARVLEPRALGINSVAVLLAGTG